VEHDNEELYASQRKTKKDHVLLFFNSLKRTKGRGFIERLQILFEDTIDVTPERALVDHIGTESIQKTFDDMVKDPVFTSTFEYFKSQRNFKNQKAEYFKEVKKAEHSYSSSKLDNDSPDLFFRNEDAYFIIEDDCIIDEYDSLSPNFLFFSTSFIFDEFF